MGALVVPQIYLKELQSSASSRSGEGENGRGYFLGLKEQAEFL